MIYFPYVWKCHSLGYEDHYLSIQKCVIVHLFNGSLVHLTSCTHTISKLYFANFLLLISVNLPCRDSLNSKFQILCPFGILSFLKEEKYTYEMTKLFVYESTPFNSWIKWLILIKFCIYICYWRPLQPHTFECLTVDNMTDTRTCKVWATLVWIKTGYWNYVC